MKRKFILCAVLVCLFWCSSTVVRADPPDCKTGELWNSHTASVQQEVALHTLGAPAYSGRALLAESSTLTAAYDALYAGLAAHKASIPMGSTITPQELSGQVFPAVLSDHPELFYLESSYQYSIMDGKVYAVIPQYSMGGTALTNARALLEQRTALLLRDLPDGEYEKALELHNRLALTTRYVSTAQDQNIYGALVEREAVCAGYARAYQYLLQQCGIEAWTVTGTALTPASAQPVAHAWNLVKLNGEWYCTDVTWDDQTNSGDDGLQQVFYAYFNITSAEMGEDHTLDPLYGNPVTTATAANYFTKNGSTVVEVSGSFARGRGAAPSALAGAAGISGGYSYRTLRDEVIVFSGGSTLTVPVESQSNDARTLLCLWQNGRLVHTALLEQSGAAPLTMLPRGSYDLTVSRDVHLLYTAKSIAITGNRQLDTITLLVGDLNGDGSIDVSDLNIVWNAANYNQAASAAENPLTDLNGDKTVDVSDLNILWNAANYNKTTAQCTVNY